MDRDEFAAIRADLWRELESYRGKPFDLPLLENALLRTGRPLDWRAALVIGELLSTHGELALSPHVAQFIARYAAIRNRRRIMDPFVRVPSLVAAVAESARPNRA